ncbi:uncharacterized protein FOMMEDRAFT_151374 [Fomitiporia mediterranea MF3/22]|uniref:uncharacterized protein n=1 Tax=Fomitiporia mediterranea (strain MF3/22) TaxID=694068 RepID=UPI0004409743|nr:uncharacterized protein FOMMEDRAFT_151374 [Fomitiporia mediterranea MF3/22]EJD08511.1 hypothetical protein FOMMEDRAFT_151374 [Fomitiporia mediterranea MF3/22]
MLNSSTRQAQSAPITAISSTLSTRSSPSVPPASQVFEPLVKSILARRFAYYVLSTSAAAAWLLATIWSTWQYGGYNSLGVLGCVVNLLSPLTLFCAVLWWTFASVPIAVLRKIHLRATRTSALSPRQTLTQHSKERQYQHALLVTFISSAFLTVCHAFVAQTVERSGRSDPGLGVWAGSKKHPYHINGRLCFLFLSQFSCVVLYCLRDVLKSRFDIHWTGQSDFTMHAFASILSSLVSTLMLSTTSTVASLAGFGVLRSFVLPVVYRLPILHGFLRPFVAHFLRPTYTMTFFWTDFDLIIRAFFLALSSQVLWDVPSTMFDVVFSLPISTLDSRKDAGLVLVSGTGSSDAYFQLHAYHGLYQLSSDTDQSAAGRSVIYSDVKHSPNLWSTLVRRSLVLLGSDYQLFLRRGNPAPPPQVVVPPAVKPTTAQKPVTPIIRAQVYKKAPGTPIDRIIEALSSDDATSGPSTNAPSSGPAEIHDFTTKLRSLTHPIDAALTDVSKSITNIVPSMRSSIHPSHLHIKEVSTWWTRERRNKAAQKALPNKELDAVIVNTLSRLVAHSLKEDTLGSVQRDIPRILEAMVLFHTAIENYRVELSSAVSALETSNALRETELTILKEETDLATEWVEDLSSELRTGISLILKTFGDRLAKFRFPPTIATRLQSFADYST